MNHTGKIVLLAVMTFAIMASHPAQAHGGPRHYGSHWNLGVYIGAPALWYYPRPYYYAPPAYYYPPAVVSSPAPQVYIERGDAGPEPERTQDYWYYCPEAQAYYPYVKQCAKGWQKVPPRPQG